jgi:acyl-coenzyme A thioesterase PaaI-like protein
MHGGCLMTFADFALFMVSLDALEGARGVTVTLDNTFVDAAWPGELVEATGEVTRAGGSLIFARGTVFTGQRTLLTFSGVIKRLRPKA